MTNFQPPRTGPDSPAKPATDPGGAASLSGESFGGAQPLEGRATGAPGEGRVRHLTAGLMDQAAEVRAASALALGRLGPAAEGAVPALVQALGDGDFGVRMESALALGRLGRGAKEAIPALIEALKKDEDRAVREASARTLGRIGGKEAVPALVEAIGREGLYGRLRSVQALGRIGPGARESVPALAETLNTDEDRAVREASARALGRIGDKEALTALVGALRDRTPEVRGASAWALGLIGPDARAAVPALTGLALNDSSRPARKVADEALRLIDREP